MLDVLQASAEDLGAPVTTACCDAADLPFVDSSFDLVFGHAVLHHLPNLGTSFSEFRRVLRPGGTIAFCGEPSLYGDRLASVPKRAAFRAAPAWRAVLRVPAAERNGHHHGPEEDHLERVVDVHAFTPGTLSADARGAGFESVRVCGEELAASLFGWANRALEATAEPSEVPWLWRQYAYRGYLALQALDRALLEPRLPAALFYNLLLSARAPA
jgi:SAM-dependent methyltransferase